MRINLLPPEERPLKASTVRWEFVVAALGVCLLFLAVGLTLTEKAKIRHLNMQLQQWTEYGSVLQRQAAVVNALRNEVKELEEEYANLEAVLADGGQIRLLDQALSLIAGELWAESAAWEQGRLRISGYAANMTELTTYVNALESTGFAVAITSVNPEGAGSFTTFTLRIEEGVAGDELGGS